MKALTLTAALWVAASLLLTSALYLDVACGRAVHAVLASLLASAFAFFAGWVIHEEVYGV